ncbi:TetR/AcrR family transcriptional regulator [Amycolatopsis samaneae]|uniref:TetR/AcrR family transcriptional regulator n=1 Tax=Amycolatopsis samaneae TaxID=664691 RepID=A0ABW5GPT3_9PSEU
MPRDAESAALSGRRGQAARNDVVILDAARTVFLADPKAPVSAVAEHAGVGISALYRRYPGKEALLCRLCHDGLRQYIAEAEAASRDPDAWSALTEFLGRVVDADVHSLTVNLAGAFTPTPDMGEDARRAGELTAGLVARAKAAGCLREDVVTEDVGLLLECCAAVRTPDPDRTRVLRRRYLALLVAGLAGGGPPLPGPPPAPGELGRWK